MFQGGRITAVGDTALPRDAEVIQGEGFTLTPGLFDLHTHLMTANAAGIPADWTKHLAGYLMSGVTTVADLGGYGEAFEPRRALLRSGAVVGPHIQMAYRITTPGGHGAEAGRPDIFSLEVLTAREGRAAIRETLPYKPDLIKIFTDGWRYGRAPEMTSMDPATLAATVDEAHKAGLPAITHTVTLARAKEAARAKVDILGHAVQDLPVDAELIALLRESGTVYTPTMAIYEPRGKAILDPLLKKVLEPAAFERLKLTPAVAGGGSESTPRWDVLRANVTKLHAAGIPIGCGTDAGGALGTTFHGWATQRELELLVGAGLTPVEAIKAATSVSARALRVADRGSIAVGQAADLVLVRGDTAARIGDMANVARVWVAGREADLPGLEKLVASRERSPLAAVKAVALLDDFESADGRSRVGTRWENSTDPGHDRSKMLFQRVARAPGNHALSMLGAMSQKDAPKIVLRLPLQPGNVSPVDAREFREIRFDVRGEGAYSLRFPAYRGQAKAVPFEAGAGWRTVRIALPADRAELLSVEFEADRKAGDRVWLELDNLRFAR